MYIRCDTSMGYTCNSMYLHLQYCTSELVWSIACCAFCWSLTSGGASPHSVCVHGVGLRHHLSSHVAKPLDLHGSSCCTSCWQHTSEAPLMKPLASIICIMRSTCNRDISFCNIGLQHTMLLLRNCQTPHTGRPFRLISMLSQSGNRRDEQADNTAVQLEADIAEVTPP